MRFDQILTVGGAIAMALLLQSHAKTVDKRGVMDNFNEGLKYAGQMFGINTAADVANLVAKAFSATKTSSSRRKPDFMSIFQQRDRNQATSGEEEQAEEASRQHFVETDRDVDNDGYDSGGKDDNEAPQPLQEPSPGGIDFGTANLVTSLLRMIGFDASKLGALAINALIMIAQAIGNTLMATTKNRRVVTAFDTGRLFGQSDDREHGPEAEYASSAHQPRQLRDDTPIDWLLQSPNGAVKAVLGDAVDAGLASKLTDMIEQLESTSGQGACLKMLMCKSSPFIWGMQNALSKRLGKPLPTGAPEPASADGESDANVLNTQGFFTHLPSIAEYREHGDECEKRYANFCNTTTLNASASKEHRRKQSDKQAA